MISTHLNNLSYLDKIDFCCRISELNNYLINGRILALFLVVLVLLFLFGWQHGGGGEIATFVGRRAFSLWDAATSGTLSAISGAPKGKGKEGYPSQGAKALELKTCRLEPKKQQKACMYSRTCGCDNRGSSLTTRPVAHARDSIQLAFLKEGTNFT